MLYDCTGSKKNEFTSTGGGGGGGHGASACVFDADAVLCASRRVCAAYAARLGCLTWYLCGGTSTEACRDNAASEDRIHDLRIMRPTRYQLRYHRLTNSANHISHDGGRTLTR